MIIHKKPHFNFLKPDFSIIDNSLHKVNKISIDSEHQFYLKHKIIHWFNDLNGNYDSFFNFEDIILNRYVIIKSNQRYNVSAAFSVNGIAGIIYFLYVNNTFKNLNLFANNGLYKNDFIFPRTSHLFKLEATMDKQNNIKNYNLKRVIYTPDSSFIDDIVIDYQFDLYNMKVKDRVTLYDKRFQEELYVEKYFENFENVFFDDFFNEHILTILSAFNIFKEIYPYFDFNYINNNENFNLFYLTLIDMYTKNVFSEGFDDNMDILKMSIV